MNPYIYTPNNDAFNLQLQRTAAKWQSYRVDFASAYSSPYPENNHASGEYFQPRGKTVPLVILLHGLGDKSALPCKMLARALAGRGIAGFVLYLPFFPARMTEDQKGRYPRLTAAEWFENYRMAVINVRQVLDWAERRPEIDKGKIGLFGISLGGFVAAITMGVDGRVQTGVLTVMGGNSAKIGQSSLRYRARRGFSRPEDEYERVQESYREYLAEVTEKGFDSVAPVEPFFMTDPLTFALRLKQCSLLMVNARWDEAIPRAATIDFWEACGRPPIIWLPATHASIWLWYPLVRRKILEFLVTSFQ